MDSILTTQHMHPDVARLDDFVGFHSWELVHTGSIATGAHVDAGGSATEGFLKEGLKKWFCCAPRKRNYTMYEFQKWKDEVLESKYDINVIHKWFIIVGIDVMPGDIL